MAYTVMSNMSESEKRAGFGEITQKDKERLRTLAGEWMEIASGEVMQERKEAWKALHGLKPVRPMILFETLTVSGYVTDDHLECENEFLRNIEKTMVYNLKQFRELGDDIVFEPYYRLSWDVTLSDHGVKIVEHHADESLAYLSNFPIGSIEDIEKLKPRTYTVDREMSLRAKELLEEIFGDILPVVIGNYDHFFPDMGFTPLTGTNFVGLTMDIFKLIGPENMMFWAYDAPEQIHRIMRYLCDERVKFFNWMDSEGLLDFNSDCQFSCPSSYGYVPELPEVGTQKKVAMKDCWVWCESQETSTVSPDMFDEFYLPYLAEVSNMFGLAYYGCCEPVDDRIEHIKRALPGLRTVSISGWNDFEKIGAALGREYVHCKKPNPAFISGNEADWESARKDLEASWKACPAGDLEIVVRDVYEIGNDMGRLPEWVTMAKKVVGI